MRSTLLLLLPVVAFAGEKKIKPEAVPAAVVKAAAERFPKGKVTGYVEETDGTKKSYEVAFELEGQRVELILAPDGKLEAEERTLAAKDLPAEVTRALAASKYAKASLERVERVEDLRTHAAPIWEVVVLAAGVRRELVFDSSGALKKDQPAGKND